MRLAAMEAYLLDTGDDIAISQAECRFQAGFQGRNQIKGLLLGPAR